jgi:dsDNA-specific endonuclease/ATPase MutS2
MSDPDEELENEPWRNGEPIQLEVTDVLDLHAFAPRDISVVVEAYLEEARARGFETVRIIHGKGKGVQRAVVHSALRRTPYVEAFQDAPMGGGGWGATIVWFKRGGE